MKAALLPHAGEGPRFLDPIQGGVGVAGGDAREHKVPGRHGVETWRLMRVVVKPPCPLR